MSDLSKIKFHFLVPSFAFRKRKRLKIFILEKLKKNGVELDSLNYIFCDDAYLLSMNQKFLSHNTFTDIITFELSSKNEPLVSDIYISVNRVRENAVTFKTTFSNELYRVVFHGLLHLLGFKDKTTQDAKKMREYEEKLLSEFFT